MSKKTTDNPSGKKKRKNNRNRSRRNRRKKKQVRVSIGFIAFVLTVLAFLIALPHIRDNAPKDKGASIPSGSYSYGIDISHYQEKIKWDSLMVMTGKDGRTILSKTHAKALKPVSFVFIKATEGSNMKDRHFRKHWEEAGKRNIRRGAYHFFRSSKNGTLQARHFIRTVGNLRYKDLPPVLDIETIHKGCSDDILNARALEWLEEVERHYGRKPIVYSSASFISDHLSKEIMERYPIWVAHYDVEQPQTESWMFWQFTDKALVYGVEGYIDLNVCQTSILEK